MRPGFRLLGRELMPDGERQSIGQIRPSGWQTVRYDDLIPDKYCLLYTSDAADE